MRRFLYTVGHSNRELEELIALLRTFGVECVADVRRFPTSSKYPHFRREVLAQSLPESGIEYWWLGDLLGGFRTGGYEQFTRSDTFRTGLELLLQKASWRITAVMCSERLFFRCHRRFIADRAVEQGWAVRHIYELGRVSQHKLRIAPDGQLELALE